MSEQNILVAGLPGSGKTTLLAALWHLVTSAEIETLLKFDSLAGCDSTHLNMLKRLWLNAQVQKRTAAGSYIDVTIRLKSDATGPVSVAFPDLSGEEYRDLWEQRSFFESFATYLTSSNRVILLVHADRLTKPRWIFDEAHVRRQLMVGETQPTPVVWSPRLAPTQVQLVDLLQLLSQPPFNIGPRKVCVVLSAWDVAEGEELAPADYLRMNLPFLHQFLECNADYWKYIVVGVSAQGGDYGAINDDDKPRAAAEAERVKAIDLPSNRIKVVGLGGTTHDLTRIIFWLSE